MTLVHHTNNWCTFCDEFSGKETSNFRYLFSADELQSRVLLKTKHFVVIPGLGPLGKAYLLILPYEPFTSMATLPIEYYQELYDLKRDVFSSLSQEYFPPITFEHGPAVGNRTRAGCCMEHAHLHIVATNVDLTEDLLNQYQDNTFGEYPPIYSNHIDGLRKAKSLLNNNLSYIWYETHPDATLIIPVSQTLESQFMRKLLANRLNLPDPEWDWALFPRKEQVLRTYHQLKPLLNIGN